MKCFKKILAGAASLAIACSAQAGNQADQLDKQVRELKSQINLMESRKNLDKLDYNHAGKANEFLTLSGYIEMSFLSSETDFGGTETDADTMGVGFVELNFDFNFSDSFKARIDITDETDGDLAVEEAWFQYYFGSVDGLSLKVGRQYVDIGLESDEKVDLYQYSRALFSESGYMPDYAEGIMAIYETEKFTFRAGLFDGLFGTVGVNDYGFEDLSLGADKAADDFGYMVSATAKLADNVTLKATYAHEDEEDGSDEVDLFDVWITWAIGEKFEVAAEYAHLEEDSSDTEIEHFLLRGTWKINDKWSLTARYDHAEDDDADAETDTFIISPSVTINENLSIRFEAGWREGDGGTAEDDDEEWYAVEAFVTF